MSTKREIQLQIQDRAFQVLSSFFAEHEDEVVEIEILPPEIQPTDGICMLEGINIGIPKRILALAFVKARQVFHANLKREESWAVSYIRDGPP